MFGMFGDGGMSGAIFSCQDKIRMSINSDITSRSCGRTAFWVRLYNSLAQCYVLGSTLMGNRNQYCH